MRRARAVTMLRNYTNPKKNNEKVNTMTKKTQLELANEWAEKLSPKDKKKVFGGQEPTFDQWWPTLTNVDKLNEYYKWKEIARPPKAQPKPKPEPKAEPKPKKEPPKKGKGKSKGKGKK